MDTHFIYQMVKHQRDDVTFDNPYMCFMEEQTGEHACIPVDWQSYALFSTARRLLACRRANTEIAKLWSFIGLLSRVAAC